MSKSFNSRTLGRVRLLEAVKVSIRDKFQFTHPGKGATLHQRAFQGCDGVSIHAPWEGCDRLLMARALRGICFNSRTLGRVRLIIQSHKGELKEFQFTHPGKGAT